MAGVSKTARVLLNCKTQEQHSVYVMLPGCSSIKCASGCQSMDVVTDDNKLTLISECRHTEINFQIKYRPLCTPTTHINRR